MLIDNILKHLGKIYIWLLVSFFVIFLFAAYENSMIPNKYMWEWNIGKLFKNYDLFSTDIRQFVANTISLHQGDTESAWKSFYYLLPLFVFSDILGGLNLQNLYFFNFMISALNIILFYKVCKRYLNGGSAAIGTFFLACASWFHEFTFSASYHPATILVALIIIDAILSCSNAAKAINYVVLGMLTGISLYFYGPIRYLWPVIIFVLFSSEHKLKTVSYFLLGFVPIVLASFLIGNAPSLSFWDEENIFWNNPGYNPSLCYRIFENVRAFSRALSGRYISLIHAKLINKALTLPLIVGLVYLARKANMRPYRLLAMVFLSITLLPVFITMAHYQPRRFLLYCIPVYMIIGLGGDHILQMIRSIKSQFLKTVLCLIVMVITLSVVVSEARYARDNIWSGKRDIGLKALADKISAAHLEGPVFYLQETPHQIYEADDAESYLLMLLLKETGFHYPIKQIADLNNIPLQNTAWIVQSPLIAKDAFEANMIAKRWNYKELFASPYYFRRNYSRWFTNCFKEAPGRSNYVFRVYAIWNNS